MNILMCLRSDIWILVHSAEWPLNLKQVIENSELLSELTNVTIMIKENHNINKNLVS